MSVTLIRARDGTAFTFDIATEEFYEPSITVTQHPVEAGVDISDHAQTQPLPFTIRVEQTESPFARVGGVSGPDRLIAALDFLRAAEGELLDVVTTKFGTLTNCLLLAYPHQVGVRLNLPIALRFQQVRVATSQAVLIPPEVPVVTEQVGFPDEQDVGVQATNDTNRQPAKEARDVSTLRELTESVGLQ